MPSFFFGSYLGLTGLEFAVPKFSQNASTPFGIEDGGGIDASARFDEEPAAFAAEAALAASPDEDAPGDGAAGSRDTVLLGGGGLCTDLKSAPVEPLKDGVHPCW